MVKQSQDGLWAFQVDGKTEAFYIQSDYIHEEFKIETESNDTYEEGTLIDETERTEEVVEEVNKEDSESKVKTTTISEEVDNLKSLVISEYHGLIDQWISKNPEFNNEQILRNLAQSLSGETLIIVKEDARGWLLFQVLGNKRNTVYTILKSVDGEYIEYKFEPTYKPEQNPDINVKISDNLLGPDYKNSEYLFPVEQGQHNIVRIKMTGKRNGRGGDFHEANKAGGFENAFGTKTPYRIVNGEKIYYTWHHLDDFTVINGEAYCTMQLVERNSHTKIEGMAHGGSVTQYKAYFQSSENAPNGLFYEK